jgi:hypothetical protein
MRRSTLSIMCLVAMLCLGLVAPLAMAIDGPMANATVSFGLWQTPEPPLNAPLDRFPTSSPRDRNEHQLIPNEVTIKEGGGVNFIIGGFHQPIVYDNGTKPGEINATLTVNSTGVPNNVLLIDDPTDRIYRGLDPSRLHLVDPKLTTPTTVATLGVQDRVEVVYFPKPGTYLVICGVRNHFVNDGMFGFVTVLPGKGE